MVLRTVNLHRERVSFRVSEAHIVLILPTTSERLSHTSAYRSTE